MRNHIEETTFDGTDLSAAFTGMTVSGSMAKFHTMTRIFLAGMALIGAMWVGHLAMSNQAAAQDSTSSVTQQLAATSLPAPETKVYAQGLGKYHWNPNCPLATARSLRSRGGQVSVHQTAMTVKQAEQHHLHPCIYCQEIKS